MKLFNTSSLESSLSLFALKMKNFGQTVDGLVRFADDKSMSYIPDKTTRERYRRFEV